MNAISPVRSSSPIVAIAKRPVHTEDRVYVAAKPCVAIVADVQDPGNMGAIVRVAEAAGADGVVSAGACADPYGWKALRGSMGSALRLPIASSPGAAEAADAARRRGCRVVATAPRGGGSLFKASLAAPVAIVIGSEGIGLPDRVLRVADEVVTIPMAEPVESLNTAVAAALLLYEARRRREG
jgi:TrmH family RNA methyltransferase